MSAADNATRIYRGVRRRVNIGKPLDSFPFLSGDSYLFSCQYFFNSGRLQETPSKSGRRKKDFSIFVAVSDVPAFIRFIDSTSQANYLNHSIVLHNGDDSVSDFLLAQLFRRFKRIYAVNALSINEKLSPIPIGLENRKLFTNGIPRDFYKSISSNVEPFESRSNLLLQAFSLTTNPKERETCALVALRLKATVIGHSTPKEYRNAVCASRFVLSPAGNGVDCHRTWESMYLNAIPIVRRAHWPFSKLSLPVLVIDEWEDLLHIDLSSIEISLNSTWSQDFWDDFFDA